MISRRTASTALVCSLAALTLACSGSGSGDSASGPRTSSALRERPENLDPRMLEIGRRLPDLTFVDVNGKPGRLSDVMGAKGLVISMRDVGCPVSKKIGNKTGRYDAEFAARGVPFFYVNPSTHNTAEEMKAEIAKFSLIGRYAVDRDGSIAKALRAVTTTDFFVLDRSRTLVYRGAIDDQNGRGINHPDARYHYLRNALEALIAGEEVVLKATSAPGCLLGIDLPEESLELAPGSITWHHDVHRILQQRCVGCHREDGAGPFPLDTLERAQGRSGMVRFVVQNELMPPWFTTDETGPWGMDHRLSAWQRAALLRWIEDDFPVGDPADAPVPRSFSDSWQIGEPDLVFRLGVPQEIPAEGPGSYRPVQCEGVVREDIWVRKIEVLPTVAEVVHHAMVMVKRPLGFAGQRAALGKALVPWARGEDGWEFFAGYLPGKNPLAYPDGVAKFLPKGTRFMIFMHYNPSGEAVVDSTAVGLVLAQRPPEFVARTEIIRKKDIPIPPFEANVEFVQDYRAPHDMRLRSLTPHMHLRGREFEVTLIHPDRSEETLIDIDEWDQEWQFIYTFLNDLTIRKGSVIRVRCLFDNSADNPVNPDPSAWVRNGPLTSDEMMMLGFEWLDPRKVVVP